MATIMEGDTVIVTKDPEKERGQVCITSDTRPHPSHCWSRAAYHCFYFKELNYFEQREAAAACWDMARAINILKIPPQRAKVEWGWGKGWPGQR